MATRYRLLLAIPAFVALAFLAAQWGESIAAPGDIERVSVDSAENEATAGNSEDASISADGRFVAFPSDADNLVTDDDNDKTDAFVRDRQSGTTERISVDNSGNEADQASFWPALSADGRYVAFVSYATNLVPDDDVSDGDVFVHDRQTLETTIVSVDSTGNHGDLDSDGPVALSADGRYVVFRSNATNLVPDDGNGVYDIFIHDRQTGDTERVSVDSDGNEGDQDAFGVSISADGRYVAFDTNSVLVPEDDNEYSDVYVRDRETDETEMVSVNSTGVGGGDASFYPHLTDDGRYVAFESRAINLATPDTNGGEQDIYRHDRQTGATIRVSGKSNGDQGALSSERSGISGDGRYITFGSKSSLVALDANAFSDVYLHDAQTGITALVSVDTTGTDGNDDSWSSESDSNISADGRFIAFTSDATDLATQDGNNVRDVFVRDVSELTLTPSPTPSPSATPSQPATPSPVHTATAVPTTTTAPTATPVPSASSTPGSGLVQGDVNCDGEIDEDDMSLLLEYIAELDDGVQSAPCPDLNEAEPLSGDSWGNLNCDDAIDGLDALFVLLFKAGLDLPEPEDPGCASLGDDIG